MLIIGVPSLIYLFKFLWTSSFLVQLIILILIFIGNNKKKIKYFKLIKFIILATIGVQAMIGVTETERGSHYGEISKNK
jgi:heme A synthase